MNPYFDSSHVYIASFLKILLHNANAAFFLGHPVDSLLHALIISLVLASSMGADLQYDQVCFNIQKR